MKLQTLLLPGLLAAALTAQAGKDVIVAGANKLPVIEQGHADIGVAFEDGEWNLHIHDGTNDEEFAPGGAVLLVGSLARTNVPADPAYAFLGRAGRPIWILPQVQNEALPFLGFGAAEIPDGIFLNNAFEIRLKGIRGPGHFAVWDMDSFGNPRVIMNTRDGIRANDVFHGIAGGHADLNWGFSQSGTYRVTFEAAATLADGTRVSSGNVTYIFRVERSQGNKWPGLPGHPGMFQP